MNDYISEQEEKQAVDYADSSLEFAQQLFERTPSRYGFDDFDDVANKNLVIANLSRNENEPEMIMRKADNVITYKRFKKKMPVFVGWNKKIISVDDITLDEISLLEERKDVIVQTTDQAVIVLTPEFEVRNSNRFEDLMREDIAFIQTLSAVSGGTNSAVLKLMRSTIIQKDQTVEDKTNAKSIIGRRKD